jgi:chromosome segregation ATPase
MTQPITDEQLQAIDKLRNDFPFSVSLDHVDTLRQALRERDAAIAELRHRLDDARTVSDRWANECSKEVAEKHALQSQLAELRNSALSYQLQRDMANALVQKQEQMLAELRKPVAVERNEVVEQIRSELWLTIEISHYTVERLIDQYDSVAERLADRVRMLGFVQDQLTSRNKENEELKERERRLRISTERLCDCANALADEHGSLLCFDSMHKRIADARAALAQPTEPNNA